MTPANFPDMGQALAAADKLVAHQRNLIPGIEEQHPDIIIGDPVLDQFWFAKHQGMKGNCGWIEMMGRWEGVYI